MDMLFPRFCLSCGYVGSYLCKSCSLLLEPAAPRCLYCEKKSLYGLTHPACKRKWGVDGVFSFFKYDTLLKKVIHKGKYEGAWRVFGDVPLQTANLAEWVQVCGGSAPYLHPVPLHPHKERARGYNQAQKIADLKLKPLTSQTTPLLARVKDTPSQAMSLTRAERKANMRDAFRFVGLHAPQTIMLVDDVITTGATIDACAKQLKKNGVRTVLAISLARG